MGNLKERLKNYAREIGIDLLGVTSAAPFDRFLGELQAREKYYKKVYPERIETWKRLASPKEVMKDARSVLVIGFYYLTPDIYDDELKARISRVVSHGHLGIIKRARLLSNFLKKQGFRALTGAHRKDAALRAGVGGIGKNGLILNSTFGSWVTYQSIVTDADIEPDDPYEGDVCGECDRCIASCPLSAIREPYRLDPGRCISYLLTSREIPSEYWGAIANNILGCDICQEVCPKNHNLIPKNGVEQLFPDSIGMNPPLSRILDLEEEEFQNELISHVLVSIAGSFFAGLWRHRWIRKALEVLGKVKASKMKEAIPQGFIHASGDLLIYKRNVLLAMGNLGDRSLRQDVEKYLNHPFLGTYARWALERIE